MRLRGSPMNPTAPLAALNFFTGDIQGGLGPFLATFLAADDHWGPGRIGLVVSVVGLASLALNGPAGLLVDRTRKPLLVVAGACAAIVAGTLALLTVRSLVPVTLAQGLTACGGAILLPGLALLTLGVVGKDRFPHQQGTNQAFNHAGIVTAALLIRALDPRLGPSAALLVLGGMGAVACAVALGFPRRAFNGRRAHGWAEEEADETEHRHPLRDVLRDRRLLPVAVVLGLYNLANGSMLALIGQRLVAAGHGGERWTAVFVVAAQLTMIPVALLAGSFADRRGRRHLLLLACAVTPIRAVLASITTDPVVLAGTELLDGVASGLIGVAVPVLVADLTWGSGRTQTALGAVNTLQGIGGALSGLFGGELARLFGWNGALLGLGVPALIATGLALRLGESRGLGHAYPPRPSGVVA